MGLNPALVGASLGTTTMSWSSRDTMLYALGVGSGVDELSFTTENSWGVKQQALPTFAVTFALPTFDPSIFGDIDMGRLLHGRQRVTVHRPIPVEGAVNVSGSIGEIQDKGAGKHAVLITVFEATEASTGDKIATCHITSVIRGAGGFGGERGESVPKVNFPGRAPDRRVTEQIDKNQALVYRLSGDRHPLHSDPWFATERGGFPRPVLHGLCTYGYAGRALVNTACGGDTERFGDMDARFTAPVFPGESLTTSIWDVAGGAVFRTTAGSEERVVLDDGSLRFASR